MPIPTDLRFVPSLVPQRFDGIEIGGFFSGIKPEEDANGAGEEKGDGDLGETNKNVERYSETADRQ